MTFALISTMSRYLLSGTFDNLTAFAHIENEGFSNSLKAKHTYFYLEHDFVLNYKTVQAEQ